MNKNIEDIIKQLWVDAWVAVASSSNCSSVSVPASWADKAVEEFKKRFSHDS